MRGRDDRDQGLFSYVRLEERVPSDHPPRAIRSLADEALAALNGRTTRHPGYAVSQRIRKRVEEVFGWVKSQAGFDQVKVRGQKKAEAVFTFATAAYNPGSGPGQALIRIPRLLAEAAG